MIKRFIKKILPQTLVTKFTSYRQKKNEFKYFQRDRSRFYNYSNYLMTNDSQIKLTAKIAQECHVVEKGLTMPEMRTGFGIATVQNLINLCDNYIDRNYNLNDELFLHSLSVLNEYRSVHVNLKYESNKILLRQIEILTEIVGYIPISNQVEITKEDYYQYCKSSFDKFSESRKSVRNFEGKIKTQNLISSIKLAQNAPSSCNRQASRAYIIDEDKKVKEVLSLQNGNRGFGQLADKLIIVTAEVGVYSSVLERNSVYIDGGIFLMNLAYSLHFNQVAVCILNCNFSIENENLIRTLCDIPESELYIAILACGDVPSRFKIAHSKRLDISQILNIK